MGLGQVLTKAESRKSGLSPLYRWVDDPKEIADYIQRCNSDATIDFVVLDIETTGLDPFSDRILNIQLSAQGDEEVMIFDPRYAHALKKLYIRVVGHNLKFDLKMLYHAGVDLTFWDYHDTLLIGHLVNENRASNSLDSYIKELWNDPYKEEFWAKYKTYEEAPKEEALEYAAKDVIYTERIYLFLKEQLKIEQIPDTLVTHVHRLQYALLKTEIWGIAVDIDYLTEIGTRLKLEIEQLKPAMRNLVPLEIESIELELWGKQLGKYKTDKGRRNVSRPEFSFDSNQQLNTLLYRELGLPPQTHEKTRKPSVDDSALERLKQFHPLVALLQSYRTSNKIYTTYIEGTLERAGTGNRIYPEFRVNGTVTGRISHSNPNLGQLPKSGGIRGIYTPDPDHYLISADYSQLEVCIEANLTGDPNLAKIFLEGLSKHDITAHALTISRDAAKTLNFALQYWASHFKVAKLLGVSNYRGLEIWKAYWELYSGPKELKAHTDNLVNAGVPLVNLFGRKRRFEVKSRQLWDKDYRQAYNFLIQSTGADITSRAFYLVADWLEKNRYGRALFSIHDELLIQVKKEFADECECKLVEIMVSVGHELGLKIPLKAESSGPMQRWEG